MAVPAEILTYTPETQIHRERYAHSLSTIRRIGGCALSAAERDAVAAQAFDDFLTAVSEMLKTDQEHGELLDINNEREHKVIDNQVRAKDGRPMVEILKDAQESSRILADADEAHEPQFERDSNDVPVAERADKLEPGQTLWAVSFVPKKALRKYPEVYKEQLGYKESLVYVQTYSKVDESTLVAGSYSVMLGDEIIWKKVLAKREMVIPEQASDNEWISYGQVIEATPEKARELAFGLRQDCYQLAGRKKNTYSISQYVANHEQIARTIFDTYYPALGEALVTGHNNKTLQTFAQDLLNDNIDLKPEYQRVLIKIANSSSFSSECGEVMDSVLRYATVEELRKGLKGDGEEKVNARAFIKSPMAETPIMTMTINPAAISIMLAGNVRSGVEADRSYGGCPGNIQLSKPGNNLEDLFNPSPQEAFGGKDSQYCPEIKNGQEVKCPECKKRVKAIVPDKENIFCSNKDCKLAHPSLKKAA